jgi:leucine dehydrogenase
MESKVVGEIEKRGHEQLAVFNYPRVGLKAIVAIHNTVLGPALGGCRMRLYDDEGAAIEDALRLAEGMTYKSSLAGLDLGGGKSVLVADPSMKQGRRELFLQFGRCLNHLDGRYITAEDMGTSVSDVMVMREVSRFAAGFSPEQGGGGDPSPWTAKGVFNGIKAALTKKFGSADLSNRTVAVQGAGHVGIYLIEHLVNAGAKVIVSDTVEARLQDAKRFSVTVVSPDAIYDQDCDVYAPSAIGQTVNANTVGRLKCSIIAGAANNVLIDSSMYEPLAKKGILYCPDFAINSGGVISVGAEYNAGGWKEGWVAEKVERIGSTIERILMEADKRGKATEVVALELAKERIAAAEEKSKTPVNSARL